MTSVNKYQSHKPPYAAITRVGISKVVGDSLNNLTGDAWMEDPSSRVNLIGSAPQNNKILNNENSDITVDAGSDFVTVSAGVYSVRMYIGFNNTHATNISVPVWALTDDIDGPTQTIYAESQKVSDNGEPTIAGNFTDGDDNFSGGHWHVAEEALISLTDVTNLVFRAADNAAASPGTLALVPDTHFVIHRIGSQE